MGLLKGGMKDCKAGGVQVKVITGRQLRITTDGEKQKLCKVKLGGLLAAGGLVLGGDENENTSINVIESEEDDEDEEPQAKKSKQSETVSTGAPVWKFAEKISKNEAKCKVCKQIYKTPGGNTSNIFHHITKKHANTPEGKELVSLKKEKEKCKKDRDEKERKPKDTKSIQRFLSADRQVSKNVKDAIDNSTVDFFIASNESFSMVENPFFRQFCFNLNKGYTLFSRRELVRKVDDKIEKVKDELVKEIQDDIKSHKSIHITSDGGNSGDQNRTHKNTLTVSRINDEWEMKTDTVALVEAVGSQTGPVLRSQWKQELEKIGYDETWKVSATTDAAKNVRSARASGRHDEIGLKVKYESDCTDHQIQLLAKDSRKNIPELKKSLIKCRKTVAHFTKSSLSRQLLTTIQKELNLPSKWILVGTKNRWFFEMSEAERVVELRESIEEFQTRRQPGDGSRRRKGDDGEEDEEEDKDLVVPEQLDDEDFCRLEKFVDAMKPFTTMSKFLSGEKYPTAGGVIPALEQIKEDIAKLEQSETEPVAMQFLQNLQRFMDLRFKNSWSKKAPYNCLTFLDPRHVDMYCLEEDVFDKIREDIKNDSVFDEEAYNAPLPETQPEIRTTPGEQPADDKRAQLLKKKLASGSQPSWDTFGAKLDDEINR